MAIEKRPQKPPQPTPPARAETTPFGPTLNEPPSASSGPDRTAPPPASASSAPQRVGRYRILKKLGQGGMGAVYLAHDEQLDRQVALKVPSFLPGDSDSMQRFHREARSAATLSHPNLCPVYDVGEIGGTHYLTMAYIEGRPLSDLVHEGPLDPHQAAEIVRRTALALEEAHMRGVIHRDLKPSNIMLNHRGEPVVMDFGLARRNAPGDVRLTQSGAIMGTPAYMSPEQVEGDIAALGPATDIYSLGVILFELLTGRVPFQGSLGQVMAQILTQNPARPAALRRGLDPKLEAICLKAMAKKAGDRFASMQQLATALATWLAPRTVPAPRPSARPPARRPASPRRWPLVAGALLGVAILLLGVILYINTRQGKVRIEINDPNAVVLIDGEKVSIENLGELITLKPGIHGLEVRRGDVVVETRDFAVVRGDNPVLKITLPREKPPVAVSVAPAVAPKPGSLLGVVIGVDNYDKKEALGSLNYAEADAIALAELFRAGARRAEDIALLTTGAASEEHRKPRRLNVRRELHAAAAACTPADTLIVAFCGREVLPRRNPEYFLGLADADPDDPRTLFSLSEVYDELAQSKAGLKLVFVDACRMPPPGDDTPRKVTPPAKVATFFGCADRQYCLEDEEHKHGIFSYHVLQGLRGAADRDRDGKVTLAELEQFIKEQVPEHSWRKFKQRQHPELLGRFEEDRSLPVLDGKTRRGEEPSFQPLFNGKDLSGWTVDSGDEEAWSIEDGELVNRVGSRRKGWLLTERDYRDFVLRLEFQFAEGANSGVTFRAASGEGFNSPGSPLNPEIQLQDDSFRGYANQQRVQKTGALYGLAIDRVPTLKAVGEWNSLEMEVRGSALRVVVNGEQVLQTDLNNFDDQAKKVPGLKRSSGRIGLQSWIGSTRFRKIEIKELKKE